MSKPRFYFDLKKKKSNEILPPKLKFLNFKCPSDGTGSGFPIPQKYA